VWSVGSRASAYKKNGESGILGMVFWEGSRGTKKQPAMMPIMTYFSVIRDPRIERNKLYPLYEVIVITILAVIALAQGWEDIERYAKAKKVWLSRNAPRGRERILCGPGFLRAGTYEPAYSVSFGIDP
jgi:hypothetical protein